MKVDLSTVTDETYKPQLYDVHSVLQEEVVGEHESRMSVFTNFICGERNCMLAGPRASGKTWIADHVTDFVGNIETSQDGQTYILTAGSDKAGWYQAEELAKCKYVVVLELNKLSSELRETLKDWGEGKDSTYRTTKQVGGARRTVVINLPRRPYVFCLADEDETKVDAQLASRLTTIRTDNSIPQNLRVMTHQAKLARLPENPLKVDGELKAKLSKHIGTLPPLEKFEWKHPAADLFVEAIPAFFTDCRRDFPKYLANTVGITRFHWKERLKVQLNGKEAYFITPQDMFLNHIIYGRTIINSALKCNNIEREIMVLLQEQTNMKKTDVQKELKKKGTTLSTAMTTKHLNQLADLGYVEKDMIDAKTHIYSLGRMFEEFLFEIDWDKVVKFTIKSMEELYPKIAPEYVDKYCKQPLVVHPFTGEKLNLFEMKKDKIKASLGHTDLEQIKCEEVKIK